MTGQLAGPLAGHKAGGPEPQSEVPAGSPWTGGRSPARGRRRRRGTMPGDLAGLLVWENGRVRIALPGGWEAELPERGGIRTVPAAAYGEEGWPEGLAGWLEGRFAVWAAHEPGMRTPRVRRQTLYLRAPEVELVQMLQAETGLAAYKLVCVGLEVVAWHAAQGLGIPERPAAPAARKRLGRGLIRLTVPERFPVRKVVYDLPRPAAALLHALAMVTEKDVSACASTAVNALGALVL